MDGTAQPEFFSCKNGDEQIVSPGSAIFPILKRNLETKKYSLIGTGFFIGTYGIFLTAKHVLMDVLDERSNQTHSIGGVHFLPNNKYLLRPILRCQSYPDSDVAVGLLAEVTHDESKSTLRNNILTLTTREPQLDESVFTYTFCDTTFTGNKPQEMRFSPHYFEGKITQKYPSGRDRTLLPNPCWQTNMHIHGGSSGGPVFLERGRVFGINSTSLQSSTNTSFVSDISHVLNLQMTGIVIPPSNEPQNYSLKELNELGHISIEE